MTLSANDRAHFAPLALVALSTLPIVVHPAVPWRIFAALFLTFFCFALMLWLAVGVGALVVKLIAAARQRDHRPVGLFLHDLARALLGGGGVARGLSLPLTFALVLASYSCFKQLALPLEHYAAGPAIMKLDRLLFLGVDPWRVTHALFPGAGATRFFDMLYQLWFAPMMLAVPLVGYLPLTPYWRARYLFAFALAWLVAGVLFAVLLPSSGPVYYASFHPGSDPYAALKILLDGQDHELLARHGVPLASVEYQHILFDRLRRGIIFPGGGISAMPSMHNALAILLACAAFSWKRWWGCLAGAYAFLIWIASVHLGWHFALDGIVSLAVMIPLWRLAGMMAASVTGTRGAEDDEPLSIAVPEPA